MHVAVLQQAGQVAEVADRAQTLQLLSHVALLPAAVASPHLDGRRSQEEARKRVRTRWTGSGTFSSTAVSPYAIVQDSVLGHAVGFTELLHPASIVAVQHLQAEARAVGAGTPGMDVVTRGQLVAEEQLAVWKTSGRVNTLHTGRTTHHLRTGVDGKLQSKTPERNGERSTCNTQSLHTTRVSLKYQPHYSDLIPLLRQTKPALAHFHCRRSGPVGCS